MSPKTSQNSRSLTPVTQNDDFHELRKENTFDEDLSLWEKAAGSLAAVRPSSWTFIDTSTIYICEAKKINVVKVTKSTIYALAVFDMMYIFWEEKHAGDIANPDTRWLVSYHRSLRNRILKVLILSEGNLCDVFQPWLMRTLCLHGHDSASRSSFSAVQVPSYLLDHVILEIMNKEVFKRYVAQFAGPLTAIPQFWCGSAMRSWEFLHLQRLSYSQDSLSDPQDMKPPGDSDSDKPTKGILLYPHERKTNFCLAVRETSFQRRGITDHSSSPATLNAGKWLNDEIINSYIDLLDETLESGVVVLTTFAYAKFSGQTAMHSHEVISLLRKKRTCSTIQQALATYRLIIMPINWQNLHWLAVVLNVDNATVTFMDSLPERDGQKPGNRRVKEIMQVLKRCLNLGVEWRPVEADVPTQGNGYDCGVFCAQFIKFVYLKLPIPIWSQLEMVELRDTMTIELFEQSLRTPRFVDKIKLNQ